MLTPAFPDNESQRIEALCGLNILDTPADPRFDRITRIAQTYFNMPIVLVSLIDTQRQWFKSRQGLDATETPRNISFCGHAILGDDVFYVPNTLLDSRFSDNPLVTGTPDIRFYAGAPLAAPDGLKVGTLCLIDTQPRSLSPEEFGFLRDLAGLVEEELLRDRQLAKALQGQDALAQLAALIESSDDAIMSTTLEGIITGWNPAAERIFGYKQSEAIGQSMSMLIPSDRVVEESDILLKISRGERTQHFDTVRIRKDAARIDISVSISPIRDSTGKIAGASKIARDITGRKRMEGKLRENERILRAAIESLDEAFVLFDPQDKMVFCNEKYKAMYPALADLIVPGTSFESIIRTWAERSQYHEAVGRLDAWVVDRMAAHQTSSKPVIQRLDNGRSVRIAEQRTADGYTVGFRVDISALVQATEAAEAASLKFQNLLDAASEVAIIATDTEGLIQVFNRGAERMLGYTEQEVVGKTSPGIFHLEQEVIERAQELSAEMGRSVAGFAVFTAKAIQHGKELREWTYIHKGGRHLCVSLAVTAVRSSNGAITGYLGIAQDITERKQHERMKSEFVSTVSHELRTPLTSIRGALGLVLGKFSSALPDKARQLLETANRNSNRLTLLINDILDLEKFESGQMELDMAPSDLAELVSQAITANEGYAHEHGVQLRLLEVPAGASVRADGHRMSQVFANLLSNAIKYSPKGGQVDISVRLQGHNFRVSVRDHGRGIPDEFRSRMFQRFSQADSSDTRERGGTGLGLSITKAIVEQHGGHIDYASVEGEGSEFFFDLPVWHENPGQTEPRDGRPYMLICEDNPDVALVLSELLAHEGIASDRAATGASAIALLRRNKYRALLLDLGLPDMDGRALIRQLRGDDATRDLPVIVVSGRARGESGVWHGEALEVLDWLQKPVDRERLGQALSQALRKNKLPRVLHVEDDADVIEVIRSVLEDTVDYVYANTLAQARQRLEQEHFDLVLLDLGLPDGSGDELIDAIGIDTQVVMFSGDPTSSVLGQHVGAALTKATTSNERLLATIKNVLERNGVAK